MGKQETIEAFENALRAIEQHERPDHQNQADEHEYHDHFHARASARRNAVTETTAMELRGIRIAAPTGPTRPAKQSASAIPL